MAFRPGAFGALTLCGSLIYPAGASVVAPDDDGGAKQPVAVTPSEVPADEVLDLDAVTEAAAGNEILVGDGGADVTGADSRPNIDSAAGSKSGAAPATTRSLSPRQVQRGADPQLVMRAKTGTPDFDDEAGPGLDTGPDNDIIRTNDIVNYEFQIATALGGPGTLEFHVPRGQEVRKVPGWCKDPNNPSQVATPSPEAGAPLVPLDATSWESLPAQTLTCKVELDKNYSGSLFIPAFQRSEVPNGTQLDPASGTLTLDHGSANDEMAQRFTVSAAPRWDVSKNHLAEDPNTGYVGRVARPCPWDNERACWNTAHTLLIGAKAEGKGLTPLTGPVTLIDELDPELFYENVDVPAGFWDDPANVEKYAPRLYKCDAEGFLYKMPNPKVGQGYAPKDQDHSVRDSGTPTCDHTAGENATIVLNDVDWSLYTYPTEIPNPSSEIPAGKALATSILVRIAIPVDAVRDLGTDTGSGIMSLPYTNRYRDFSATGLDGTKQTEGDEEWNNYRSATVSIMPPGAGAVKYWAGYGKNPYNTPAGDYAPGDPYIVGPPGSSTLFSGDIPAGPGEVVLSSISFSGSNLSNPQKVSGVVCDSWDNSKAQLQDGDYPAARNYGMQQYASEGKAVWIGGRLNYPKDYPFNLEVEYSGNSHSGSGIPSTDEAMCRTGDWYSDPAEVPGNDPEALAEGRYTAVNAVRIHAKIPEPKKDADWIIREHYNIALWIVPGQAPKTIIPNWQSYSWGYGDEFIDLDTLLAGGDGIRVVNTNYDPSDHSGSSGRGDRLIYAPAYVRILKDVQLEGGTEFTNIVSAAAGDRVTWRLRPTINTASAMNGPGQPIIVEDCLPPDFTYVSATVSPTVLQPAPAPADAEIACEAGTYLRFRLEDREPNTEVDPLFITTKVSSFADTKTYTNMAAVQTEPADPTALKNRTSVAQVDVTSAAGVRLEKTALTPLTQVNDPINGTLEENVWEIALINLDAAAAVSDVDIVDALPIATGLHGSDYAGTMEFVSTTVTAGDGVQVLYTSGAVDTDPRSDANGPSGVAWCDAPGGTVVHGQGECPATAADVTGLRLLKPGVFAPGDEVRATVTMVPKGNAAGDVYINRVEGAVEGLDFNVGPVDAPETVIGSSLGDYVWNDENNNGIQDDGETPVAGFHVTLTGTDDLGNSVTREAWTDTDGRYTFADLREGTYTVTFDPNLDAQREFSPKGEGDDRAADSDGDPVTGVSDEIALAQATDRTDIDQGIAYKLGSLAFAKISPAKDPLAESQWELRPAGPLTEGRPTRTISDCTADPCTGADTNPAPGAFRVAELRWGAWELIETQAPAGYQLDQTPHRVTIGADGVAEIDLGDIVNEPYSFDLPHTGGTASLVFLGLGGGILALAILTAGASRRRRDA